MKKTILTGALIAFSLAFTSTAWAFSCPSHFKEAQASIDSATTTMKAMSDKGKAGLVHTLLDDAKMLLQSAKHHHEKPAAGTYDHARSLAKADSAKAYAEAAETLAKH
jgi:hypothetical protein